MFRSVFEKVKMESVSWTGYSAVAMIKYIFLARVMLISYSLASKTLLGWERVRFVRHFFHSSDSEPDYTCIKFPLRSYVHYEQKYHHQA